MARKTNNIIIDTHTIYNGLNDILVFMKRMEKELGRGYIRNFNADMRKHPEEKKNITPEKCVKLLFSLELFMDEHRVPMTPNIKAMIDALSQKPANNLLEVYNAYLQCSHELFKILKDIPFRVFDGAKLFYLNKKQKNMVLKSVNKLKDVLSQCGAKSYVKRFSPSTLVKMLDDLEIESINYHVKEYLKYPYVKEVESVEYYLPRFTKAYINKLQKDHNEYISTHPLSDMQREKMIFGHNTEIERINREYEYMINNKDRLDIRIIGYKDADKYPKIMYNRIDKVTKDLFLNLETPNLMWFEPIPFKQNMTVTELIETGIHAYGNVYYQVVELSGKK